MEDGMCASQVSTSPPMRLRVSGPTYTTSLKYSSINGGAGAGELNYFFGVEVHKTTSGLFLNQKKLSYSIRLGLLSLDTHWKAVKRVLRYLKGTLDALLQVIVCTWETILLFGARKISVVSMSSSEAECRSLANSVSEVIWVQQLLSEVGVAMTRISTVWCDNTSTVSMAANLTHHGRIKHVEIDLHLVRGKVLDGKLQVNFIPSEEQTVNVLTKAITAATFSSLRHKLRVLPWTVVVDCQQDT
ncbi:hypothetical protein EPI10_005128 [Gossypium australe]|uniref:Uncharacterized protein n=1 Tax=Gossypium australe TaxID=47621 RepID=A0A5B6WMG4_9ROSI|nr:hypothetical protein EPI10_005128 [Gossypium australe]